MKDRIYLVGDIVSALANRHYFNQDWFRYLKYMRTYNVWGHSEEYIRMYYPRECTKLGGILSIWCHMGANFHRTLFLQIS